MSLPAESLRKSAASQPNIEVGHQSLPAARALEIHRLMVRTRAMEERMIRMSKSGEAYFWIGGPGEEAFNVCLGLQVKKGCGPAFDYLHFHYRNSPTMVAMGMSLLDGLRQMSMRRTDPFSMGRNFVAHYSRRQWNLVPGNSVLESQYAMAAGTALMQKRHGGDGISIVTGGEAGTAEGDFSSCLIWSARPGSEVPVLIVVTNNGYGISTPVNTQLPPQQVLGRAEAFGIPTETVDGNDPVASWHAIERAMNYCRRERKPFLLEAHVSRLYGHSSSSGAARVDEPDCIELFEQALLSAGAIDAETIASVHAEAQVETEAAYDQARSEPSPSPADVPRHVYAPSRVDAVYPDDFDGLPGDRSILE